MTAPSYDIEEVHVMLVDNDREFVIRMTDLLKSYGYKVMMVGATSAAMSMLSKGKQNINVMILNVHSSNMLSFKLLAQAVALDIISLIVCDEHNEHIAKKALDEGAYICLKKPIDKEIVKYLWQFVLTKKLQREKAREGSTKNRNQMNVDDIGNNNIVRENEEQPREKKNVSNTEEQDNNNDVVLNKKYKLRRKRDRKSMEEINEGEGQSKDINKVVWRKNYLEWTDDLHAKFMKAAQKLGEGRCYPKEILEEMNVPGLTRMQISSHLQKWRHPSSQGSSSDSHEPKNSFKKFGTMPRLRKYVPKLQRNPDQTKRGPEFPLPTLDTNNIFARGESSIQQLYRPQLPIQAQYLSICNPFNNPFLLVQNDVGGGIQQQHGTLFGKLNSQGQQGLIIGNTNCRSGLALNSGDHHTQSDYNLNLNVVQGEQYSGSGIISGRDIKNATINNYNLNVNVDNVTTYSRSAKMSDTYVGNMTIYGLGVANLNFQQYIGAPNMSDPSNTVTASYECIIEGRNTNEKEHCDAYFDFNNMDYPFKNRGHSSATLPNEQGSEFDQVYFNDQVAATSSVQFPGITNYSDESAT